MAAFIGRVACILCLVAPMITPARAQDASPDRMVAEWMVRMGGSVVLEGQHRSISDLAELPTSDFYVHTLNFTGITQWAFALGRRTAAFTAAQARQGSLYKRAALVRSAGLAGRGDHGPFRRLARAGDVGVEPAGPDLYSVRRHRYQSTSAAAETARLAHPPDARRGRGAGLVPAQESGPEL